MGLFYLFLNSTRIAISKGRFSNGLHSNFVEPMFPLMEGLQNSILAHFKVITEDANFMGTSPLVDPEEISHQMDERYTQVAFISLFFFQN